MFSISMVLLVLFQLVVSTIVFFYISTWYNYPFLWIYWFTSRNARGNKIVFFVSGSVLLLPSGCSRKFSFSLSLRDQKSFNAIQVCTQRPMTAKFYPECGILFREKIISWTSCNIYSLSSFLVININILYIKKTNTYFYMAKIQCIIYIYLTYVYIMCKMYYVLHIYYVYKNRYIQLYIFSDAKQSLFNPLFFFF